jgi:hypothetical protein
LEFLRHPSIADLITLLFSSLQNSEGGGNGTAEIVVLTPAAFYQPLSFTFETFGKKLSETKSLIGSL